MGVPAPGPGVTSGDTHALTSTGRLVTFNRADPALDTAIAISGLQSGETVVGLDVRAGGATHGQLIALGSTGRIYSIDPTSGAATLKSTLAADAADTSEPFTALSGTEFGVDFNPVTDRLRVISDTGQNLRIDVDSGATVTDAALAAAGISGAAYTNAFASACRTRLYYIDTATDQLLTTDDPNGGATTVVGPLGVDASAAGDLEIATAADGTNSAYAVLVVGGVPTSYQVNLDTGFAVSLGAVTLLDTDELVRDVTIAPPATDPAQTPGELLALTESNRLISFNQALPQKACTNVQVSGQASGENLLGIDVRPADGALYAMGSTGTLYTVDVASGALTLRSTLVAALGDVTIPYTGLLGTEFGFDFNPGNDLVRVVSDAGMNFRVSLDGAVTTDMPPTPAGSATGSAAYSNNFVSTFTSTYFMIDALTDGLQVMGRTSGNAINGDIQVVGPLGAGDVLAVGGFDIYGTTNRGLAALTIGSGTTSELFEVNLSTGAATRIESIAGGERVRGLAYARVPVATVYALTSANRLVSFKPLTPATFDTDVAITGLDGAEQIVGIDFNPVDGVLHAMTNANRVYVLDPATGALSGAVTLTANPLDATDPFTALSGTQFGVDFGSVDGVLRVQSDTGQNLRVNLADGTVITDGPLVAPTQVVGTAFSNPYAGASTSLQYAIDVGAGNLIRQRSFSGALQSGGPLNGGTTFQLEGGFDIGGADNGLGLAALLPAGAAQSALYRVDLGQGTLLPLGPIGPGGTVVRGIAIRVQ